jgi:prepilin-type N-terminal cleavage/methylation domain-containing protein
LDCLPKVEACAPHRRTLVPEARLARRGRAVAGFTLLEIIMALVLMGIVYAMAVPAIGRARIGAAVHNSRHIVVSSISLARATALRFGRLTVLRLDASEDRLWIEADTSVSGGALDTIGFYSFAGELATDLQSNRSSLCFNGRGIGTTSTACPQAGALIVVSLGGEADSVLVTALGRVFDR